MPVSSSVATDRNKMLDFISCLYEITEFINELQCGVCFLSTFLWTLLQTSSYSFIWILIMIFFVISGSFLNTGAMRTVSSIC